ncbi:ABC transporter permease [Escherichia coli]|nr:ABC transporter permease [Escherichia coli]
MSNPILSWRRVRALCVKETRQIVRDPSSWLIAVVIPLLLLFIFGYGINLDSSKLRVGILLEQRSEAALDFTHTMTGSPYIDATISDNRQELIAKNAGGENSRSGGYSGGFCGTDGARQRHRTDSGDHRRQ